LNHLPGGVRCERASALLNKTLGERVQGVFQLKGGIEKYLQEVEGGGFWKVCYHSGSRWMRFLMVLPLA
jgi:predicted sulfurtransferase